jgi:hypothetical protein
MVHSEQPGSAFSRRFATADAHVVYPPPPSIITGRLNDLTNFAHSA